MTKQDAIELMKQGFKVTHEYFSDDEFIYMIDEEIYDESGYKMKCNGPNGQVITFWTDRTGPQWEEGWSKYKDDGTKMLEANEPFILENTMMEAPLLNCDYADRKGWATPIYFSPKHSHKRTNKRK